MKVLCRLLLAGLVAVGRRPRPWTSASHHAHAQRLLGHLDAVWAARSTDTLTTAEDKLSAEAATSGAHDRLLPAKPPCRWAGGSPTTAGIGKTVPGSEIASHLHTWPPSIGVSKIGMAKEEVRITGQPPRERGQTGGRQREELQEIFIECSPNPRGERAKLGVKPTPDRQKGGYAGRSRRRSPCPRRRGRWAALACRPPPFWRTGSPAGTGWTGLAAGCPIAELVGAQRGEVPGIARAAAVRGRIRLNGDCAEVLVKPRIRELVCS